MKKEPKRLIAVSILFVLALASIITGSLLQSRSQSLRNIAKELSSVVVGANQNAEQIFHLIEDAGSSEKRDSVVFYSFTELYRDQRAGVFVYDTTGLRCWTTNRIPAPLAADSIYVNNALVRLSDGWYFTAQKLSDDYRILYFLLIKHDYSYENEYLDKDFNRFLSVPDNVLFSIDSIENSEPVLSGKTPLFYVTIDDIAATTGGAFLLTQGAGFMLLIALLALLWQISAILVRKNISVLFVALGFAMVLTGLRILMLRFQIPSALYALPVFSPVLYAESFWYPSLGDLGISLLFFCVWTLFFMRYFTIRPFAENRYSKGIKPLAGVSVAIVAFSAHLFISARISSLILNSSIELNLVHILRFSAHSVLAIGIVILLLLCTVILFDKIIRELRSIFHPMIFIISLALVSTLWYLFAGAETEAFVLVFLYLGIMSIILLVRIRYKIYNWYSFLALLIVASLYISEHISWVSDAKEIEARKVLANNLMNERDVGAEFFITTIDGSIRNDTQIEKLIHNDNTDSLYTYFSQKYIKGYLNKYDLQVSVCKFNDSILIQPDNKLENCFTFFGSLLSENGIPIPGTNFYYLENHTGRISYFGYYTYPDDGNSLLQLFVELNIKVFSEGLGYPELLLDKKFAVKKTLKEYSYAKYNDGALILKKGDYEYPMKVKKRSGKDDYRVIVEDSYSHLYYYSGDDNLVVLSIPEAGFKGHFVSFSYLFFVVFLLFSVFRLFVYFRDRKFIDTNSLKNRIQFSIVSIILISILVIGFISVYFIVDGYTEKHNQMLRDKLQSVLVEIEHKFKSEAELDSAQNDYVTSLLIKFSNVFYTDINIFGTDGKLITSSRMELFEKGLQGTFMHPKAYRQLHGEKNGLVIINERIGTINYLSAYIPFRNADNQTIAYINLPYFSKQDELNDEITGFIIAFTNVFLILIILSIAVGIIIANQLTKPLSFLQESIRAIDISKKTEKIDYLRNDELGSLIREYNKKIDELAESAGKLAKSERESAWREMAKQIAHEIKNPLTPIKLSIQYLEHTYKYNDKSWEETLKKVAKTIVEQIDTLSAIATEFSNFAQMPQAQKQPTDLIEKIKSSLTLFQQSEPDIEFRFIDQSEGVSMIVADPEQLTRIFNNLIKNSIQAIPDTRKGNIVLSLQHANHYFLISISDNGTGIDEAMKSKIFQPSFTTKTSGMGLGLSMVKNITDQMGGEIWYETVADEGTTFFIRLPEG